MSDPKPTRGSYHHGDLRRALVDAALEILAEQGADSFTLRELARRVGVNHRAAYRHFADKTAVFAAVAEQGYLELVARMEAARAAAAPDLEAEVFASCEAYVAFALDRSAHFRVMLGPRLNEDGRFPELERAVQAAWGSLVALMDRAQRERGLRGERDDAVITLWAATHGLATLTLGRRLRVKRSALPAFTRRALAPVIAGLFKPA
jgi:AcrR family transcriptional regulator